MIVTCLYILFIEMPYTVATATTTISMVAVVTEWVKIINVTLVVVATHTMIGVVIIFTFFASVSFKCHF